MKDIEDLTPAERVRHYIEHLKERAAFSRQLIRATDDAYANELEKTRLANIEEITSHLEDAVECNAPRYITPQLSNPDK